jgi:hypothetical protein
VEGGRSAAPSSGHWDASFSGAACTNNLVFRKVQRLVQRWFPQLAKGEKKTR